jgi:cytochrome c oxidase assembly protein subunit 15
MKALYHFARFNSIAAFFLLIAGGLVTSTGSGLAVPDWPLSYGRFFPRMEGGVLFEHGHRLIAGSVGLMTWALALWVYLYEKRSWVRYLASAAALGIAIQAILGGITVLYGLPATVSIAHACLAQAIFCLLLILAEALTYRASSGPYLIMRSQQACLIGILAISSVYAQLILGAILRHTGRGLLAHILVAFVASAVLGCIIYRSFSEVQAPALHKPAALILGLLPLQWILGLASLFARSQRVPLWTSLVPTAHLACGALILGAAVIWTMRLRSD